jgi:hypothetical protein
MKETMASLQFWRSRPPLSRRLDAEAGNIALSEPIKAMITSWERRALSAYAQGIWSQGARRDGLIVDGGPFVGASTMALAEGLSRSPLSEPERLERIWSYDLFITTQGMEQGYFGPGGPKAGESFRAVYDANVAPLRRYLRVFEGDIRQATRPNRPISILFLDVLWNWDATAHVSKTFYVDLEPQRSLIVHQDFCYPFYPWVVLSMGMLKEQFPVARRVPYSSVVFDVNRILKPGEFDDPRNLAVSKALVIYDEFIDAMDGYGRGALALGKALFLASHQRTTEARELVSEVESKHGDDPLVIQFVQPVLSHCQQVDLGVALPLDQVSGY